MPTREDNSWREDHSLSMDSTASSRVDLDDPHPEFCITEIRLTARYEEREEDEWEEIFHNYPHYRENAYICKVEKSGKFYRIIRF